MSGVVVGEFVRLTKLSGKKEIDAFHKARLAAFDIAKDVYTERAASYNVDHEPFEEMPFGAVSLASEMFKRMIRMTGLLSPERENSLTDKDVERLEDTAIDLINYASWMFAVVEVAKAKMGVRSTQKVNIENSLPFPGGLPRRAPTKPSDVVGDY